MGRYQPADNLLALADLDVDLVRLMDRSQRRLARLPDDADHTDADLALMEDIVQTTAALNGIAMSIVLTWRKEAEERAAERVEEGGQRDG